MLGMRTTGETMKLIGHRWTQIRKGSKITVKNDYSFVGFESKITILPSGEYYICGFWCDAMGLSKSQNGFNDFVCPSAALQYFYV